MDAGPGILYVVSTPIGNLGDMTPRAVEVLSTVDMIAAEDTRTAAMLLQHFGIEGVRMIPNHKFNEKESAGRIVSEILSNAVHFRPRIHSGQRSYGSRDKGFSRPGLLRGGGGDRGLRIQCAVIRFSRFSPKIGRGDPAGVL